MVVIINKMIESVSRSINVDCTVRPRSTVDGGTKQLKPQNRTKRGGDFAQAKKSGFERVTKRIGAIFLGRIQKLWKNVRA